MAQARQTWTDWMYEKTGLASAKSNLDATASNAAAVSDLLRRESRNFTENRSGISYQKTVHRGEFCQAVAAHYRYIFDQELGEEYHVLVLYDKLQVLGTLYDCLDPEGHLVPVVHINKDTADCCIAHHKVGRGWGQAGRWGFDVYAFKHGKIQNLGDGGYVNWCWQTCKDRKFIRYGKDNKEVKFE